MDLTLQEIKENEDLMHAYTDGSWAYVDEYPLSYNNQQTRTKEWYAWRQGWFNQQIREIGFTDKKEYS